MLRMRIFPKVKHLWLSCLDSS